MLLGVGGNTITEVILGATRPDYIGEKPFSPSPLFTGSYYMMNGRETQFAIPTQDVCFTITLPNRLLVPKFSSVAPTDKNAIINFVRDKAKNPVKTHIVDGEWKPMSCFERGDLLRLADSEAFFGVYDGIGAFIYPDYHLEMCFECRVGLNLLLPEINF